MKRGKKIIKSDEEIQEIILKFLYEIHKKSGTLSGSRLKITDIKKELKKKDLSAKEIIRNLNYLIQNNWIKEDIEKSKFKRDKSLFDSERKFYKISSIGVDHFQGPSKFQKIEKGFGNINIENVKGIIQIGEGNYVNANYDDLYKNLSLLNEEVKRNIKISNEEKLNYWAEIETIKSQLSKLDPNKSIIKNAWENLTG